LQYSLGTGGSLRKQEKEILWTCRPGGDALQSSVCLYRAWIHWEYASSYKTLSEDDWTHW